MDSQGLAKNVVEEVHRISCSEYWQGNDTSSPGVAQARTHNADCPRTRRYQQETHRAQPISQTQKTENEKCGLSMLAQ